MGHTGSVLIDLHTHSTESDGTDTPAELVAAAVGAGLGAIAITDHDTTAGWAEAGDAVRRSSAPLRLVPGAELSCACPDQHGRMITVHLLAYLFDPESPALVREQSRLRAERRARLREMARGMAADGFPVDPDEIMGLLPEDSPGGRPHLARALVRGGTVGSVDEAFARYLGSDGRYYLPRTDTPVLRAIEMIGEAGGVTVLAHPFATARGRTVSARTIAELAEAGLGGVEVDHPDHNQPAREELRELAANLDLIPTGSSDYHGTNKTIRIGQETTAQQSLERLIDLGTGSKVIG
ncbi:PHP domain-containing protein [Saccharopolyspora sp. HNM0983]|uniref:PHP domain-containing protein n=1 Tax=Saccharopolyspora montiporae TaxID=2781240 RepID=A0A929FYE8_9PSEU|nr:PHP domain-containing protein [Saccharopolyspora sp. HNM0983]MBE9375711.1 PHP domain-containing protein [Saccharopolyspora sp. HNM0983]